MSRRRASADVLDPEPTVTADAEPKARRHGLLWLTGRLIRWCMIATLVLVVAVCGAVVVGGLYLLAPSQRPAMRQLTRTAAWNLIGRYADRD